MGILMKNGVNYSGGLIEVKPEIYSEEEREIGTWIDGKPLYEKVIFPTFTQDLEDETFNIANIDKVISLSGMSSTYTAPIPFLVNLSYRISVAITQITSIGITLRLFQDGGYIPNYIVLRYTKTTDTPGSGLWSTTGAPAHHYSQNEQIVGTWIDGKPLYEKTFSGTFSVTSTSRTWYSIYSVSDLSSLNIDKCMFVRGLYKEPTQSFYVDMGIMKGNDGIYCSMTYNPSEGIRFVVCNGATGTGEFIFTLQYTKTTD